MKSVLSNISDAVNRSFFLGIIAGQCISTSASDVSMGEGDEELEPSKHIMYY